MDITIRTILQLSFPKISCAGPRYTRSGNIFTIHTATCFSFQGAQIILNSPKRQVSSAAQRRSKIASDSFVTVLEVEWKVRDYNPELLNSMESQWVRAGGAEK